MASRMERYYQSDSNVTKRAKRNQDLYRTMYDEAEYSNIEGIATIEKTNEIDLNKIKELLREREHQGREIKKSIPEPVHIEPLVEEPEDMRNYDIRDVLLKAKNQKTDDDKIHSLKNTQYNILKSLNVHSGDEQKEELKELVHTITNTSALNKMGDKELCLDLLNDLKSNTMTISNSSAMDILLKEEKKKKIEPEEEIGLDKSFYTSSLNFNDDDFEQLRDMNTNLKKNNLLIKILLFILLVIVVTAIIFAVYEFVIKR